MHRVGNSGGRQEDNEAYWNESKVGASRFSFDGDGAELSENDLELFGINRNKAKQLSQSVKTGLTLDVLQTNDVCQEEENNFSSDGVKSARFHVGNVARSTSAGKITEMAKLESENRSLKKNLESATLNRFSPEGVKLTITNMITGKPFMLEVYRAKAAKLALLDAALESHDGNAITAAVIHLKKTLKPSLFKQELVKRPTAVAHHLRYLRAHAEYSELCDFLSMLGRQEEAAIVKYKFCLSYAWPEELVKNLKHCHRNYFGDTTLAPDARLVEEHISLLERQLPIEDSDSRHKADSIPDLSKRVAVMAPIVNTPLITTLYYCCLHHYDLPENHLASPLALRKWHHLTDKQFTWTALAARAHLKQWVDVDRLLTSKGWLGNTKANASVDLDKAVELVHRNGAPVEVMTKFIRLMEGSQQRLNTAKKYKCHPLVVDTLVQQKNRVQLEEYRAQLLPHSNEFLYAQDALRSSTVRWKN